MFDAVTSDREATEGRKRATLAQDNMVRERILEGESKAAI